MSKNLFLTKQQARELPHSQQIARLFTAAARLKAEGRNPVDLMLGNPRLKPGQVLTDALSELATEEKNCIHNLHGYMPNMGFPELRAMVAAFICAQNGVEFNADTVLITAGANNAIDVCLATLLEPGDEVIVLTPGFLEYTTYVTQNNGRAVLVPLTSDYRIDFDALGRALGSKTKALIMNFPHNPTGALIDPEQLQDLTLMLNQHRQKGGRAVCVLEDSPYDQLYYSEKPKSMLETYPHTIYLNSFSKSHGLAGERIGYLAVHPQFTHKAELHDLFNVLGNNIRARIINAPAIQQRLILKCGCKLLVDKGIYERRMRQLEQALAAEHFDFKPAQGAFYVFAQLPDYVESMEHWVQHSLTSEEPLLAVPGTLFGGERYQRFLRFSVTPEDSEIDRGARRIRELAESYRIKYKRQGQS